LTNFAGGRDIVAGMEQLKYRCGGFVTLPIFDGEGVAGSREIAPGWRLNELGSIEP
jgi:hypothetical protein